MTDVKVLSTILGHAQASTTLNLYAHALPDHKRVSMEKIPLIDWRVLDGSRPVGVVRHRQGGVNGYGVYGIGIRQVVFLHRQGDPVLLSRHHRLHGHISRPRLNGGIDVPLCPLPNRQRAKVLQLFLIAPQLKRA